MNPQSLVGRSPAETFALRLKDAMERKGMSNSDIARQMWGEIKDSKGYTVARNRDRIGSYLKGKSIPEAANLAKLAEVLGLSAEDLLPAMSSTTDHGENRDPEINLTVVQGHTDRTVLRVHKVVPLSFASKIIALFAELDELEKRNR